MIENLTIALVILAGLLIATVSFLIKIYKAKNLFKAENQELKSKYSSIISVDDKVQKRMSEIEETKSNISKLTQEENNLKNKVEQLQQEASIYDLTIEYAGWGYYKPIFNLTDSEAYIKNINKNREKQKEQLNFELERIKARGGASKGVKLPDYAFNQACDAAISKVNWKNVIQMEKRIEKAFKFINKNSDQYFLTDDVLKLKIEELRLNYEYSVKKNEEKEEQQRIKSMMQEEERERKAIEKAKIKAEKEEKEYFKALTKAQQELKNVHNDEKAKLMSLIQDLEAKLSLATQDKERAISMAQQTKRGYVYIISNIGSFGNDIYKIGLTRRLNPQERVDELGDASVPFKFDVHGMIYSENAPELESKLHEFFKNKSVNLVNFRKEFFNVTILEIESACKKLGFEVELTKLAEAREYYESKEIRNELQPKIAA